MPLDRIKSDTLGLVVDGKQVDIKVQSRRNFELNKALLDPQNFSAFAADPKTFAAQYDFSIDQDIAEQLAKSLKGISSIDDLGRLRSPDDVATTVWAVVSGAFSIATAKVAVAF